MAAGHLDEIIASLKVLPVAAVLADLETYELIGANDAAAKLLGSAVDELVGTSVISRIAEDERPNAKTALAALADEVVDGYQAQRTFVSSAGERLNVSIWGRRLECPNEGCGLWIMIPGSNPSQAVEMVMQPSSVVLAITDHDWQIEYMSADAQLLGCRGSDLRGFPLLGLIHPSVAPEFLAAAGRVSSEQLTVTLLTRMRVIGEGWADRYCLMVAMDDHQPPRLGVVISSDTTLADESPGSNLQGKLRHCALEARATESLKAVPTLSQLPNGNELSARQTEILAHLVEGHNVQDIGRMMFLSPSTIRNHLAAIYQKFGVHSQAELLSELLRTMAAHDFSLASRTSTRDQPTRASTL